MNEETRRAINQFLINLEYQQMSGKEEFYINQLFPQQPGESLDCYAINSGLIILNKRQKNNNCLNVDLDLIKAVADSNGCELVDVDFSITPSFFIGIPKNGHH